MAKKPWDVAITDIVGKAIPNELSKISSVTKYIPYIGQVLQILGAIDAGATTYSDVYQNEKDAGSSTLSAREKALWPTAQQTIGSYTGGANPGSYGSSGNVDRNWADYVGMAGNIYGNLGGTGQGFTGKMNYAGLAGNATNLFGVSTGNENIANVGQNINTAGQLIPIETQNQALMNLINALNKLNKSNQQQPLQMVRR